LALGSILIQQEYNFSDEETAAMIRENPYLRYFCGMQSYDSGAPFDPSMMARFRKRFTPEILGEINEMVIKSALGAHEAKRKKACRRRPIQTCAPDAKGTEDGEPPVPPEPGGGQSASTEAAKVMVETLPSR
jgi:IS5 family transposase